MYSYADTPEWTPAPVEAPKRVLRRAIFWLIGMMIITTVAEAFVIGYMRQKSAAAGLLYEPDHALLDFVGHCVFDLGLVICAVLQARRSNEGDVVEGLALHPIERPGMLIFFSLAVLIVPAGFAAYYHQMIHSEWGWLILDKMKQAFMRGPPVTVWTVFFLVIGAPVAEELFFRGWLWSALEKSWTKGLVFGVTGFFFLAAHAPSGGVTRMIILFPAMFFISGARLACRSTLASMLVHGMNNLAAAALMVWLHRL